MLVHYVLAVFLQDYFDMFLVSCLIAAFMAVIDGSKMKAKLRKKRSGVKDRYDAAVTQYCQLHHLSESAFNQAEQTMRFPWTMENSGMFIRWVVVLFCVFHILRLSTNITESISHMFS